MFCQSISYSKLEEVKKTNRINGLAIQIGPFDLMFESKNVFGMASPLTLFTLLATEKAFPVPLPVLFKRAVMNVPKTKQQGFPVQAT